MVVGYFVLPFTSALTRDTVLFLVVGMVLVAGLLVWHIQAITVSPYPRARAIGALAIVVPLVLLVFAATYYLVGRATAGSWSQPLSRLDALYFSVTVFATVGFGDIVALSQAARAAVTAQMVVDLVLVGLIANVIAGAVKEGLARRGAPPDE